MTEEEGERERTQTRRGNVIRAPPFIPTVLLCQIETSPGAKFLGVVVKINPRIPSDNAQTTPIFPTNHLNRR